MDYLGRKRVITDRDDKQPYLVRYYLLFKRDENDPVKPPFNLFVHHILKSDGVDLHDHPWAYFTCILAGGYWETVGKLVVSDDDADRVTDIVPTRSWRRPGFMQKVPAVHTHRLELEKDEDTGVEKPCWTLFAHFERTRPWGFYIQNNGETEWETSDHYLSRKGEPTTGGGAPADDACSMAGDGDSKKND